MPKPKRNLQEVVTVASPELPYSEKLYVGVDQSLVCTSVAFLQRGVLVIHRIRPTCVGAKRLVEIHDKFAILLADKEFTGLAIEGYSMNSKGLLFQLGELGGVLRLVIWRKQSLAIQVPPLSLKKFITGHGIASKTQMIAALSERFNVDIEDDNDADAASLAMAALWYYENPVHPVPSYREGLHLSCSQICGVNPNVIPATELLKDMDRKERLGTFEKRKRGGKEKPKVTRRQIAK